MKVVEGLEKFEKACCVNHSNHATQNQPSAKGNFSFVSSKACSPGTFVFHFLLKILTFSVGPVAFVFSIGLACWLWDQLPQVSPQVGSSNCLRFILNNYKNVGEFKTSGYRSIYADHLSQKNCFQPGVGHMVSLLYEAVEHPGAYPQNIHPPGLVGTSASYL